MIYYIETSAILAMACGERDGEAVERVLQRGIAGFTSQLTRVECSRVLHRRGGTTPDEALLMAALLPLETLALDGRVLARASAAFPREFIRTLDALHVATALLVAEFVPELVMIALDHRVRVNSAALGLRVLPVLPGD